MSREARQVLIVSLILTAIGLAFLFSASGVAAAQSRSQDAFYPLKRQMLWAGLGLAGLAFCWKTPLGFWRKAAVPLWVITLGLLALCLVPGLGARLNGASRWLRAGGWFLQPSEIAKLSLPLLLASLIARDPTRLDSFRRGFVPCFGAIALTCALVVVEPDVGTTAFLAAISVMTLVVAGARLRHLAPVGLALGGAVALYVATHFEHVQDRIHTWLHPEADPLGRGLQIRQSLLALGAGGWFGEGLGRGTSKLFYLPEVRSDFILPLVGEELGFLGAGAVLLLFAALGLAGRRIMAKARDPFAGVAAFALTMTIILQAAMNAAVVTASMPTKGIPLPFLSAGGSSLFFTLCSIGILMAAADAGESAGRAEKEGGSCASSSPEAERAGTCSPASRSPSAY